MSAVMNVELMPIGCKSRYTNLDYDFHKESVLVYMSHASIDRMH